MSVVKEEVCYFHRCVEAGGTARVQGHAGSARVRQEAEGGRKCAQEPYCGFSGEDRQAGGAGLALANSNIFIRFCYIGVVASLVPGPRVIRASAQWPWSVRVL